MYNEQKNLMISLVLVGVWIFDCMCPSSIVNLNSGLNGLQLYTGRQVVKDQHYNHQYTEQKVIFFIVLYIYSLDNAYAITGLMHQLELGLCNEKRALASVVNINNCC